MLNLAQNYLCDLVQTFTDVRALKVMTMCQIITMYLNGKKIMAEKLLLQWNVELVAAYAGSTLHITKSCCKKTEEKDECSDR